MDSKRHFGRGSLLVATSSYSIFRAGLMLKIISCYKNFDAYHEPGSSVKQLALVNLTDTAVVVLVTSIRYPRPLLPILHGNVMPWQEEVSRKALGTKPGASAPSGSYWSQNWIAILLVWFIRKA